ncbi:MAG: aromatic ring-hydroxylating dioxygenase subunit alpha [bacterium]|nr:aromatic ring-hydroxylating dioxygenase subunit alpha [bacterium]
MNDTLLDADGEEALYSSFGHFWLPVAYSTDLTGDPVAVRVRDNDLVLARLNGEVRAFADLCPHRGARLSLGWVEDDSLRCAYHGWLFDCGGACIQIPGSGDRHIPARARLRGYQCVESGGLVWVCLEEHPRFDVPRFAEYEDPGYRIVSIPAVDWNAGAARRVENFIDLAHIPWVHDGQLGSRDRPELPSHDLRREGDCIHMWGSFAEVPSIKTRTSELDEADPSLTSRHNWRVHMPLTVWWQQVLPGGRHFGLLVAALPVSRGLTRTFMLNFRNFAQEEPDGPFCQFQVEIAERDRAVVESQRPEQLPLDLTVELHTRAADKMSIEYRRWLVELTGESRP